MRLAIEIIERRERKTGRVYLAGACIHGFPRQEKTFKRLTDAKLWAQQTEVSIRKGDFQNVVSAARSKTLKDVMKRYHDDVLPQKVATTQRAEANCIAFWERELGAYALSYIEPEKISEKLRELGDAGDGRVVGNSKHVASVGQCFFTSQIGHDTQS